jgi:hypothetical protein
MQDIVGCEDDWPALLLQSRSPSNDRRPNQYAHIDTTGNRDMIAGDESKNRWPIKLRQSPQAQQPMRKCAHQRSELR